MIPFNLTATNHLGNSLVLTGRTPDFITEYSGFDPPQMNIMATQLYNKDGALYQGAKSQPRDILLTVHLLRNVTTWRTALYNVFTVGQLVTLRYERDSVARTITGVVDKITTPQFDSPSKGKQIVQISIVCNNPWWESDTQTVTKTITKSSASSGSLTFSIPYDGDIENGFLIDIDLTNTSQFLNPTVNLTDANGNKGKLVISSISLAVVQDHVYIDSVNKRLYAVNSQDEEINLISLWERKNKWLKMTKGTNTIKVSSTLINVGSVTVTISYNALYQGV